jgi:hypothetical protein
LPELTKYRVKLPSAAVAGVVICSDAEFPVVGFGVKVAVAPEGRPPSTANVTEPGKFVRVSWIVNTAVEPGAMVTEAGVAFIDKALDKGALTVRPAEIEPLTLPLVPLTVMVLDATGVLDVVLMVRVVLPVVPEVRVTVDGLKDADAPLGKPLAVRVTVPLNPPVEVIATV